MNLDDFFQHLKNIADRYIWTKHSTWIRCEDVKNAKGDPACPIEAMGQAKIGDAGIYANVGRAMGLSHDLIGDIASAADVPHDGSCSCKPAGIPDEQCNRRAKIRARMMEILDLGLAS